MKRKTAKEILAESFRELAQKKAIDKIKVRDITDNCGYSPATFYRQFRDKYDLIAWSYSEDLKQIIERFRYDGTSWKDTFRNAADYYMDHREYLANLLKNTSGYDAFVLNMTDIHFDCLKEHLLKAERIDSIDEKTEMLIRMYVHGTVDITCEWILGIYSCSPDDLVELYELSIPEALRSLNG